MAKEITRSHDFMRSSSQHPATKWDDEALVNKLIEINNNDGCVKTNYLNEHYPTFASALQNHGRRRIFSMVGLELRKHGSPRRKAVEDLTGNEASER